MLEWLVTLGAAELGKAIFEQVLKLGQAAAEDYVKDFFRGCLDESLAAAKPEVTKKAVAEALQAFLLLVTDELEDQALSKAEIRDRYDPALAQFVQAETVKPLLGKAFERDCGAIDAATLSTVWQQSTLRGNPFPVLPDAFDWQRVGREYLKKVRRIMRETPDLRSLLETQLLEDIARNTTQLSPGFDVAKYRDSLHCSYGHLKLYAIDSTDRVDAIKLWNMFIEQTVREALPPTRYELPLDLKRQLQEQGQLESDLSPNALEHYRQEYFQQPSRKVLEAIGQTRSSLTLLQKEGTGIQSSPSQGEFRGIEAHAQRAVILGDPGAGKSTLLQYLALAWVEGKTEALPLLIELREYAIAPVNNVLDFLHRGRGVDWQFDQQQLHHHLQTQPTLVMFDGLDEVFDRATQSVIIDDIIRFTQQYPQAQVLITSRIIGYNPDRLQQAKFRHFTIQPLNTDEIHEFIDRWYRLALGNDPDKSRLVTRLKDAIANSTAIQNLADNPLLLTMMAILNRRQELPRDRADLYDQASRVLLYHWDVDHKRLQLPMDAIGRREKQEMLRLVAYEMQAGEEGLKGNLISAERLTQILTQYLRDQGFGEPREKANGLIDQLRHRNWILCDRGADTYGFVHRTFLEYFCAIEIVNRFEKQRTLSFEQLRDEVFGQHWQDETWHEVLRLICGMADPKYSESLIQFLLEVKIDKSVFLDSEYKNEITIKGLSNLSLASDCLTEMRNLKSINHIKSLLLEKLKQEIENPDIPLNWQAIYTILDLIASNFPESLDWLHSLAKLSNETESKNEKWLVGRGAVFIVAKHFFNRPGTLPWLQEIEQSESNSFVRGAAIEAIAANLHSIPETLPLLKDKMQREKNGYVRAGIVLSLSKFFCDDPETLPLLKRKLQHDEHAYVRETIVEILVNQFLEDPETFNLLSDLAIRDPFTQAEYEFQVNPRKAALEALFTHYPTHPKTLELLRNRATNDPDEQLRQWAQEQLKMQNETLHKENTP